MYLSRPGGRALIGVAAALTTVLTASLAGGTSASATAPGGSDRVLPQPMPASQALDRLDSGETADVADLNGWSVQRLVGESSDPSLWVDAAGKLFYQEDTVPAGRRDGGRAEAGPFPYAETFTLHSLDTSQRTIYLDFTGHTVIGTAWNTLTGVANQPYGAYDSDGNPGSFSNAEMDQIQAVWQRVAEDYRPFNVDVTTEEPPASDITRSGAADQVYGTRLLVTPTGSVYTSYCASACGGVAYVGVFDDPATHSNYQPGFVFTAGVGTGAKNIAEAASHEIGHNLGLSHDGTSGVGYYAGHGAWAPIMGVGYYRPVSQWSRGEYADANNTENDLTVMGANGALPRPDDHGDTRADATNRLIHPGAGVMETESDVDFFRFKVPNSANGKTTVTVDAWGVGANVDSKMDLLGPLGGLIASKNPAVSMVNASEATGLGATVKKQLTGGKTYYVRITGTGYGDPATTGYSEYGSIGRYTLRVDFP